MRSVARIHPLFGVLIIAVFVVVLIAVRFTRPVPVKVAVVSHTQLRATLSATGFVESVEARVTATSPGRILRNCVDENHHVKAGQLLATLDSDLTEADARAAGAAVQIASEQAQGVQHAVQAMRRQAPGAIGQAQAALQASRAQLRKLEAGSRPEEIAAAAAEAQQARSTVETAKLQLRKAKTALEEQSVITESTIHEAESLLSSARANEQRLRSGSRPQEVAQAEAAVRDSHSRAELAAKELERAQRLFKGGAISSQQVDAAETALISARAVESQAKEQLNLLRAGARKEELEVAHSEVVAAEARLRKARAAEHEIALRRDEVAVAQSQVQQAEAAMHAATAKANLVKVGARPEEIQAARAHVREAAAALDQATSWIDQLRARERDREAARAGVRQAGARLQAAKALVKETRLVAPFDGVVARRYLDPGELVVAGAPVFLIVDLSRRWVAAEVEAEDIGKIHPGQLIEVTAEGYPSRVFPGRVRELAAVAEPKPGGRTRARIIRAKIDLLETSPELKPGMEVDVQTHATLRPGALVVPNDALLEENGSRYVFVVAGPGGGGTGIARRRTVKPGVRSELEIEVIEGLQEGERVVVEGKEGLRDGTSVRIAGK